MAERNSPRCPYSHGKGLCERIASGFDCSETEATDKEIAICAQIAFGLSSNPINTERNDRDQKQRKRT